MASPKLLLMNRFRTEMDKKISSKLPFYSCFLVHVETLKNVDMEWGNVTGIFYACALDMIDVNVLEMLRLSG